MKSAVHLTLAVAVAWCSGCAVGPDYRPPAARTTDVPQGWHARLPHDGAVTELAQWWRHFDDPLLADLVETAEQRNPGLDVALAAIREARAGVANARSGLLPNTSASGSATRNGGDNSTVDAAGGAYTLYEGSLDAGWELDLFGGTRRGLQASQARLGAAQAQWDEARVSLAAEVADAYVSRRHCERLVDLYRDTLVSRRETLRLTQLKLKAGFAAPAEEAQARAGAYDSENQLLAQQGLCTQDLNRLVALTGLAASELQTKLETPALASTPAPAGSTGAVASWRSGIPVPLNPAVPHVPAAILSQRPDLVASERRVAAASADIGVAVASRLPSLTLIGSIGINRIEQIDAPSRSWSWGPSLNLPLFEGGAGRARLETARARYDQAEANYRSAVLSAVQEVENALVRVDASTQRAEAARLAEENYGLLLASQENRYRLGASSLLDLEETRRLALASREALASVQLEISRSWIALYKAVGGGWNSPAGGEPLATQAVARVGSADVLSDSAQPNTQAGAGA